MNFNFTRLLNGSLRILNIANRTLPLIKEATPTIKTIKEKYQNFKKAPYQANKKEAKPLPFTLKNSTSLPVSDNMPTFFT